MDEIIIERLFQTTIILYILYDERNLQDKLILSLYLMLSISYCFQYG